MADADPFDAAAGNDRAAALITRMLDKTSDHAALMIELTEIAALPAVAYQTLVALVGISAGVVAMVARLEHCTTEQAWQRVALVLAADPPTL